MDYNIKLAPLRRRCNVAIKAFRPGLSKIEHIAMDISEEFVQYFHAINGKPIHPMPIIFDSTARMIAVIVFG